MHSTSIDPSTTMNTHLWNWGFRPCAIKCQYIVNVGCNFHCKIMPPPMLPTVQHQLLGNHAKVVSRTTANVTWESCQGLAKNSSCLGILLGPSLEQQLFGNPAWALARTTAAGESCKGLPAGTAADCEYCYSLPNQRLLPDPVKA